MSKHPNYERARAEGVQARAAGELASVNPYPEGHDEHEFFLEGFNDEDHNEVEHEVEIEKELDDDIPF